MNMLTFSHDCNLVFITFITVCSLKHQKWWKIQISECRCPNRRHQLSSPSIPKDKNIKMAQMWDRVRAWNFYKCRIFVDCCWHQIISAATVNLTVLLEGSQRSIKIIGWAPWPCTISRQSIKLLLKPLIYYHSCEPHGGTRGKVSTSQIPEAVKIAHHLSNNCVISCIDTVKIKKISYILNL